MKIIIINNSIINLYTTIFTIKNENFINKFCFGLIFTKNMT